MLGHTTVDVSHAVLTAATLETALAQWDTLLKTTSADHRNKITVNFTPGMRVCGSQASFHQQVMAMGVHILENSLSGLPSPVVEPPFAAVCGDSSQPGLQITWSKEPEVKFTLQMNTRCKTVAAKGKRGAIEAQKDVLLTFLGQAVGVKTAAPAGKRAIPKSTQVSIKDMLIAAGRV